MADLHSELGDLLDRVELGMVGWTGGVYLIEDRPDSARSVPETARQVYMARLMGWGLLDRGGEWLMFEGFEVPARLVTLTETGIRARLQRSIGGVA